MNNFEIDEVLDSMSILVDTREQPSKRAEKRYQSFSVPYQRMKLEYGDYAYNFSFRGSALYDGTHKVFPHVVIERKQDLNELSQCFCQSRDRFEREFMRAIDNNASIYLLVEDASWENLINGKYKTRFNPAAYFSSITAWMARYNMKVIFCKSETSGKLIKEILYRELKERLQRGEYDWLLVDG